MACTDIWLLFWFFKLWKYLPNGFSVSLLRFFVLLLNCVKQPFTLFMIPYLTVSLVLLIEIGGLKCTENNVFSIYLFFNHFPCYSHFFSDWQSVTHFLHTPFPCWSFQKPACVTRQRNSSYSWWPYEHVMSTMSFSQQPCSALVDSYLWRFLSSQFISFSCGLLFFKALTSFAWNLLSHNVPKIGQFQFCHFWFQGCIRLNLL